MSRIKITFAFKLWLIAIGGIFTGAIDSWWWLVPGTLTGIAMVWAYKTYERADA